MAPERLASRLAPQRQGVAWGLAEGQRQRALPRAAALQHAWAPPTFSERPLALAGFWGWVPSALASASVWALVWAEARAEAWEEAWEEAWAEVPPLASALAQQQARAPAQPQE